MSYVLYGIMLAQAIMVMVPSQAREELLLQDLTTESPLSMTEVAVTTPIEIVTKDGRFCSSSVEKIYKTSCRSCMQNMLVKCPQGEKYFPFFPHRLVTAHTNYTINLS